MGHARARLHCAVVAVQCCSLILVQKKKLLHTATSTPRRIQHGAMYRAWRKTLLPHPTDAEKRCKQQKQLLPFSILWCTVNRHAHIMRLFDEPAKKKILFVGHFVDLLLHRVSPTENNSFLYAWNRLRRVTYVCGKLESN
jgi:hypothetical protein